jgi:hypothetical protein
LFDGDVLQAIDLFGSDTQSTGARSDLLENLFQWLADVFFEFRNGETGQLR